MYNIKITQGLYKNFSIKINKKISSFEEFKPSSSSAISILINILTHNDVITLKEANVIDMFCCTGRVGVEMLSSGAKKCTFIDYNKSLLSNLNSFCMNNIKQEYSIYNCEIGNKMKKAQLDKIKNDINNADIIFMDPPYEKAIIMLDFIQNFNTKSLIVLEYATKTKNEVLSKLQDINVEIIKERKIDKNRLFIFFRKIL